MPPSSRSNDRHRVVLTFDDGVTGKLICPESGCVPGEQCGFCGHTYGDPEGEPCYDCKGVEPSECWVKSWFDNLHVTELLHGEITVEIDTVYDFDHLEARIVAPVQTEVADA